MQKAINPFVYNHILNGMPNSTIPAHLTPSYSQNYEDVIIDSFLRVYFKSLKNSISICYVEIGANHPVCTSSTFFFREKYNIRGILVEANPELIPALEKYRQGDLIVNSAVCDEDIKELDFHISNDNEISSLDKNFVDAWSGREFKKTIKVPCVRINEIMEKTIKNNETLLFIDVEGMDLKILKDLDYDKYKPLVIVTEPSDGYLQGTSDKMIEFLNSKNYKLLAETNSNLIFVRN